MWLAVVLGSAVWGAALIGLNAVAPKPFKGPTAQMERGQSSAPPSAVPWNQKEVGDTPPSLSDLFSRDFPTTMKLSDDSIGIQWKDNGSVLHLKRQLYLDFPANNKFVGFYVPSSDPSDLTRTSEVCLKLAQVDAVQQAIGDMSKKTFIAAGMAQTTTIEDLTFSGRVFIYHEELLSIPQQADIIRVFSAKHYKVEFMGPDYLGKRISAWHQQHDANSLH